MNNLETLASFLHSLKLESLPEQTIRKAKLVILDVLECYYGADVSDSRIESANKFVKSSTGSTSLWGTKEKVESGHAAFYNALRASESYRNDLVRSVGIHAGAIAVSVALAMAEEHEASGEDVICAVVAGYEAMGRIAKALKLGPGWRTSAVAAVFASVAAACRCMKVDNKIFASALSFATHFSSGNNQWGADGTGEDVFQAGWGAMNGIMLSRLAECGAEGTVNAIEGDAGLLACFNSTGNAHYLTDSLGTSFYIDDVEFKVIEGCIMVQSPGQLASKFDLDISRIKRIDVSVPQQALRQPGCDSLFINGTVSAKMNIRYVVAYSLIHKSCSEIKFNMPYENDVIDLMGRIRLKESPEATGLFPSRIPCDISVELLDGTLIHKRAEDFHSLSESELLDRLYATLSNFKSRSEIDMIVKMVHNIDASKNMKNVTAIL